MTKRVGELFYFLKNKKIVEIEGELYFCLHRGKLNNEPPNKTTKDLVASMDFPSEVRVYIKTLVYQMLKQARISCSILFLLTCLTYKVIPKFVEHSVNLPHWMETTAALDRKVASLKNEIIRRNVWYLKQKSYDANREISYNYLNLTRHPADREVKIAALDLVLSAVDQETNIIWKRHSNKWMWWTGRNFPVDRSSYDLQSKCSFFFPFRDDLWFRTGDSFDQHDSIKVNNHLINETDVFIPSSIETFLSKGPKFRLPHIGDQNFITNNEIAIDTLSYKLRWLHHSRNGRSDYVRKLKIPFDKNTVHLPPKMDDQLENNLKLFEAEAKNLMRKEVQFLKKGNLYKKTNRIKSDSRIFLKQNNLLVIPSDKSNRNIVVDKKSIISRTEDILNDNSTYKYREKSKNSSIENQANCLIRNKCRNNAYIDYQKLLTCGSHPAYFRVNIKDHKDKINNFFPLRPITSVIRTPTQKVDWLVSVLLNQLVKFVPAHLDSSKSLIKILNENADKFVNEDYVFISLDVQNLYPSIPIAEAIAEIETFAKIHWNKIDNYGFRVEDLVDFLKFISYNYEITYNNKTYLQIKGCPMGAHFAPPFAIIYMNAIETIALDNLNKNLGTVPLIYKRYIDDIILGPYPKSEKFFQDILHLFNSANNNINFTIEIPENDYLNFLDISISVSQRLRYKWYSKSCHSGITMRKDSWLPNHIKNNFVLSSIKYVHDLCSDTSLESVNVMKKRLYENGFKPNSITPKSKSNTKSNENQINLCVDFISDSYLRKINKLVSKYELPVRVTCKPGQTLVNSINTIENKNKCNCKLCKDIGPKYMCSDKYIVYNFECKICHKNYIGQTCRPLKLRHDEHRRSLNCQDRKSALSEHSLTDHADRMMNIDNFQLSVLNKQKNSMQTKMAEARFIALNKPQINRKHELI